MVDLGGVINTNNLAGTGNSILGVLQTVLIVLLIGGALGFLIFMVIRPLMYKYRAIIIEHRAGENLAISVDRARALKKDNIEKVRFLHRGKESMEELPYKYLFPTIAKGFFSFLTPKYTMFCFSSLKGVIYPTNIEPDYERFRMVVSDSHAKFWRDLERRKVEDKYNRTSWLKQNAGVIIVMSSMLIGMVLILLMIKSGCGG